MGLVKALYNDPYAPILFRSPTPLVLTEEQDLFVRSILHTACSDSRFADKAYDALRFVLKGGSVVTPIVTSLNPASAHLGDPAFTLHVIGTGFGTESVIIWNGGTEPTTFVSDTELTTEVDMSTAQVAMQIPVSVQTRLGNISEPVMFDLQPAAGVLVTKEEVVKKRIVEDKVIEHKLEEPHRK